MTDVRPPLQRRSRASFDRVLDAATAVLEEDGWDGFTLAEVSRRANVSIGSIYKRVPSKDVLFYAVHDRFAERDRGDDEDLDPARFAGLGAREVVERAIEAIAARTRKHAALLRVFMHRGAVDEGIASRGSALSSELGRRFQDALLTKRDEIRQPDPELAVDVAWRMVYCTLARQIMYGPTFESSRPVEWDALVAELAVACSAYLLG